MVRMETIPFRDFMSGDYKKGKGIGQKIFDHVKRNKRTYVASGLTVVFLTSGADVSFASAGFNSEVSTLYWQLVSVGRWVIIFKGAIEIIQNIANGDFESVKKKFVTYLVVYIALLALPWAMYKVDQVFPKTIS